jgi:hypothetical protein
MNRWNLRAIACPLVLVTGFWGCGDNRGGDVPLIRDRLNALAGVEIVDVVGHDELWPFVGPEAIRVDLRMANGHLALCDVTPAAFDGTKGFLIARIGDYVPIVTSERDINRTRRVAGCPDSVEVTDDSAFLELLPFSVRSVTDVVANFDRLLAVIAAWPDTPKEAKRADRKGWIRYHKTRSTNQR